MQQATKDCIRLLLVDDHPLVLQGIKACLEPHAHIQIVAEARDGQEALRQAQLVQPDVILMDISMPGMNGLEATRQLHKASPEVRILILTMHENKEYTREVLKSGARGYILKDTAPADLVQAIEAVHRGQPYFSPAVMRWLLDDYVRQPGTARPPVQSDLSRREREVLALIADGLSNKEIACRLGVSIRTIETYRERIMAKLDIHNMAGLIRYALERGLTR